MLWVIDSSNNEGTNSRVTGELGRKGWFVGHGCTNGAIKLAMAGYLGKVVPISSILDLLIL